MADNEIPQSDAKPADVLGLQETTSENDVEAHMRGEGDAACSTLSVALCAG